MIILAFSDLHAHKPSLEKLKKKSKKADIVIAAGDMSLFGHYLKEVMAFLASLHKPVLVLHGNHETPEEILSLAREQVHFVHNSHFLIEGVFFLGWGGGGFAQTDNAFEHRAEELIKQCSKHKKVIFITHQPPYGTRLDNVYGTYVGNKSFRTFISKAQPMLAISGHIHETAHKTDVLGRTMLVNPGREGLLLKIP